MIGILLHVSYRHHNSMFEICVLVSPCAYNNPLHLSDAMWLTCSMDIPTAQAMCALLSHMHIKNARMIKMLRCTFYARIPTAFCIFVAYVFTSCEDDTAMRIRYETNNTLRR
ncbi:hypothetical protein CEXT_245921 [Caerostris extrusa]|uniref:Uncharacterized protein n=1 Tax=Caerostris extrusa TaxID=172846 RepID=A0AAV4NJ84_CAEEX|nr:hypothetical protein CEXT_245921 [Caerostris extrusa]